MLPERESKKPKAEAGAAAAGGGPGAEGHARPGSALGGSMGHLADVAADAASISTRTSTRDSSVYTDTQSEKLSTAGSVASIAVQAELMIGLSYNPLTARLAVEVVKGTNFTGSGTHKPGISYSNHH